MPSAFGMVRPNEKRLSGSSRLSFFFGYQLEKDANDERFRVAADPEVVSRSERHFLFKIGVAERTDEAASPGIPDADQSGWNGRVAAKAFAIVFDGCDDRGLNGRIRH